MSILYLSRIFQHRQWASLRHTAGGEPDLFIVLDTMHQACHYSIMRRFVQLFLPMLPVTLCISCLMAEQYRIVRIPGEKSGNTRYDPARFKQIDAFALETPSAVTTSLDALALHLTEGMQDDLDKTRAIWRWITARIAYDTGKKNYHAGPTLRDRRGTCQGYSELFVELARRSCIKALEITGRGRGSGYLPGERVAANHAWNAVLIDGKWHLLDATYGAGHVKDGRFIRDYREHFFLTPPDQFIYTHLPDLRRWQLRKLKISRKEFKGLPFYRPGYFDHGLRQTDENSSSEIECGKKLALRYDAPRGVMITINLRNDAGKTLLKRRIRRVKGVIDILLTFKDPGTYYLYGWAGPEGDPDNLAWAFTYLIVSK